MVSYTISINPINDDPDLQPDTIYTNEDTPTLINTADLLLNDSDIEGDALPIPWM